jgi:asparagine synthase (glutamine-hydrolysing)
LHVPLRWDYESFLQADSGVLTGNRTLFANVYQVPPGYFLLASRYGTQLHRYWDFDYPRLTELPSKNSEDKNSEDSIEKLRYTLDEAIRLRLRADVPVGCYLSGGVDSSTVLGIAATHQSEPIHAFTVAFDDEAYNEESIAREMAAHVGAHFQVLPFRQSDLAEHFADTIWHCETIVVNANAIARYLLNQTARKAGYKVVLTGDGSDGIFGSYRDFHQGMLHYNTQGQDRQTIEHLRKALKLNQPALEDAWLTEDNPTHPLNRVQRTLGFVPAGIAIVFKEAFKSRSFYSPAFLAQIAQRDAYRILLNQIDVQGQLTGRDPGHQSLYLWAKTVILNSQFRRLMDGVEMAHSIEGRVPFLDHKVVELVRHIPISLNIRGMTAKYALREAAQPFITDTVYRRKSHPFRAPPSTKKPNEAFFQFIQDTLRGSTMAQVPFYNQASVIQLLDKLPTMIDSERRGLDSVLMKMLSACILQERFKLV